MFYILPAGTDIVSALHEHKFWYVIDTDDMKTEFVTTEVVVDALSTGIHIENVLKEPWSHDFAVVLRNLQPFESVDIRFNFVLGNWNDGYTYEEDGIKYKISASVIRVFWGNGDQSFCEILRNSIQKGYRMICTLSIKKNKYALFYDNETCRFILNSTVVAFVEDNSRKYESRAIAFVKFYNWYILVVRLDSLSAKNILFAFDLNGNFEGAYSYDSLINCICKADSLFISKLLLTTK